MVGLRLGPPIMPCLTGPRVGAMMVICSRTQIRTKDHIQHCQRETGNTLELYDESDIWRHNAVDILWNKEDRW